MPLKLSWSEVHCLYIIFNFLIILIISIENKCLSDAIWGLKKGGKKFGINIKQAYFYNVDYPNHTLVGGVSVNSFCQQGRLFALSENRHSIFFYKWELLKTLNKLHKCIECALIICCFNLLHSLLHSSLSLFCYNK